MKREDKVAKRKWDGGRQDNDKMEMCEKGKMGKLINEKGSFEQCLGGGGLKKEN
jgi:hypothetical protein